MRVRPLAPALLAVGLLAGCGGGIDPTPPGQVIAVEDRLDAPALQGPLLDGGELDPGTTDGVVAVVNFWGSWCGPCRLEAPELQEVADANPGVLVIGVGLRDQPDLARQFREDRGITYPSVDDPSGELTSAFAEFPIARTPSTVVVDDAGRVAAVYAVPVSADELQRTLDQLG